MLLLDKAIAALVSPLGTSLVLGILALAVGALRWRRGAIMLGAAALVWIYVWSTPWASLSLRRSIESQHPAIPLHALPDAEVAVVLGGGVQTAIPPLRPAPDLGQGADRVWHAARLFHAGKVRYLVLSGGVDARWGGLSEAESMREFLVDLGVPPTAIWLETQSANTRENAARVAELLKTRKIERVALVTLALHMPRARRLFAAQGIEVIPAATDHEAVPMKMGVRMFLPDAEMLDGSGRAFKEWLAVRAGR